MDLYVKAVAAGRVERTADTESLLCDPLLSERAQDLEDAESRWSTPNWKQSVPGRGVDGSGAVNYRGLPADKIKTGGWKASAFIHVLLTGDAAVVFGVVGNLVPYLLTYLHLPLAKAASTASNYMGIVYLLPIFWGYLADTYLGNFAVIGGTSIICFSGLLLMFLSTTLPGLKPECIGLECPEVNGNVLNSFLAGLYLTAVGAAGLLPCGTSMGQDQFDDTDEVEKKQGSYFFTSFYANLNLTALFCVTVLFYVQTNKGYDWGFGVITGIYLIGVASFLLATPFYRHRRPKGSAVTRAAQVIVSCLTNMRKQLPNDASDLHELDDGEVTKRGIRKIVHTDKLRFLDKAAIVPPPNTLGPEDSEKTGQKVLCTVTQVEELKIVIQILPIWTCCISVYTVFAQLIGVTLMQASSLDRKLGSILIPPGSIVAIMMITAMCIIPVYELILVPILRKWTGHPQGLSDLKRMGVALFIAILAMMAAALVENKRVKVIAENNVNPVDLLQEGFALPLKFYWLFPQYQLLGLVEFLLGVAQLNFFYSETPDSMRGLATSLYFTSVSVGFFVSSVLLDAVNKYTKKSGGWLKEDLLTGGLRNFYILLAVLMIINWFTFLLCSHWYTYKKVQVGNDKLNTVAPWKKSDDGENQNKEEVQLKDQTNAGTPNGVDSYSHEDVLRISMKEATNDIHETDPNLKVSRDEANGVPHDSKTDNHSDSPTRQPKMD